MDALAGEVGFEVAAEVVLVADQDLPWPCAGQRRVVVQKVEQDLTFVGLRAGERVPDRQAVQGGDQVQRRPQK